jgi:hypothetical protein
MNATDVPRVSLKPRPVSLAFLMAIVSTVALIRKPVEPFAPSSRGGAAAVAIHSNISDLTMDCFAALAMTPLQFRSV